MLRREHKFGFVILVAALLALCNSAHAQRTAPRPRAEQPALRPSKPTPRERNMLGMPPGWAERLEAMTPEEQERFFNNNARFKSLPPERQEQIRRRLQALNNMSPQQRKAFDQRTQVWDQLSPDQQRYVRDTLLPEWKSLAPGRRIVILQKLRSLRGLDDTERTAKLNDDAFLSGLDPGERNMLRDLSNLRVGGSDPASEANP